MQQAMKHIFWLDNSFKARYLKLQVIEMVSIVDEDAQYGRTAIQISKLEFVNSGGSIYSWPNNASISASSWITVYDPLLNVLNPDFSKMCVDYNRQLPFEITIYLGQDQFIDFNKWRYYRWWTANDTSKFPSRNMKTWKLLASNDNQQWFILDEVDDYSPPAQNNILAYTSNHLS